MGNSLENQIRILFSLIAINHSKSSHQRRKSKAWKRPECMHGLPPPHILSDVSKAERVSARTMEGGRSPDELK